MRIIFTPQYVDIPRVARETRHIHVFAQHMDCIGIGRGIGSVLPEAVKEAGAVGVLLNHAEKRLTLSEINRTIKRADEVGLATLVCADTPEEAAALAHLAPNIILAEPPELIGSGEAGAAGRDYVARINELDPRDRSADPRAAQRRDQRPAGRRRHRRAGRRGHRLHERGGQGGGPRGDAGGHDQGHAGSVGQERTQRR